MIASYIIVFTCIWWVVFFMALPFGIKTINPSKRGFDSGAPKKPHIGIKMLATTIITLFLTIAFIYIINNYDNFTTGKT